MRKIRKTKILTILSATLFFIALVFEIYSLVFFFYKKDQLDSWGTGCILHSRDEEEQFLARLPDKDSDFVRGLLRQSYIQHVEESCRFNRYSILMLKEAIFYKSLLSFAVMLLAGVCYLWSLDYQCLEQNLCDESNWQVGSSEQTAWLLFAALFAFWSLVADAHYLYFVIQYFKDCIPFAYRPEEMANSLGPWILVFAVISGTCSYFAGKYAKRIHVRILLHIPWIIGGVLYIIHKSANLFWVIG